MISRTLSGRGGPRGDDVHVGVESGQGPRRLDLGHADARGVVEDLPLQVGGVDDVGVDDPERPDARRRQVERRGSRARRRRAAAPWPRGAWPDRPRRPRGGGGAAGNGCAVRRSCPDAATTGRPCSCQAMIPPLDRGDVRRSRAPASARRRFRSGCRSGSRGSCGPLLSGAADLDLVGEQSRRHQLAVLQVGLLVLVRLTGVDQDDVAALDLLLRLERLDLLDLRLAARSVRQSSWKSP